MASSARSGRTQIARTDVLGVGVSAIDMERALAAIDDWVRRGERTYVCVTNVHSVMECQRDAELRRIYNQAGLVTPDGMPLVWVSRMAGFRGVRRVYGPDLLLEACARSESTRWRHFFYGGTPEILDRLVARLTARFPRLAVCGAYAPPFRAAGGVEDEGVLGEIDHARPDLVWVGLGCPKQERWMAAHRGRLAAPVLVGVGAAFDFLAGLKRQAPRWMQRRGLEWAFRLASEPRRLWHRYLVYNPLFVWGVARQLMAGRSFVANDAAGTIGR